ncbi:hypothetical protein D9757_002648 [Collybiopsis confluens]|uniref:Uncharacterized protein n=1 Tax=Collybiopsis confluens TaxID=2823264 RepID=A0A8H5HVV7_9AGAR|nr:hypothetical protein D9757_002648 [Collybiopsis confluens]
MRPITAFAIFWAFNAPYLHESYGDTAAPASTPPLHFCRWGFSCTRSFSSASELIQHIVQDHVRTAIPVNRDEIPVILRITEGIGSSFETEHFLSQQKSEPELINPSQGSNHSNHSAPEASLPSPPMSTASHPRRLDDDDDKNSIFSGSSSSGSRTPSPSPTSDQRSRNNWLGIPSIVSPRFASLDASTGSPRPGSIPPSPTFSDILASSTQREPRALPAQKLNYLSSAFVPREPNSSLDSCAIVTEQLSMGDRVNIGGDGIHDGLSTSQCADDLYAGELAWKTSTGENSSYQLPETGMQRVAQSSRQHSSFNPACSSSTPFTRRPSSNEQIPSSSPQPLYHGIPTGTRRQSWYAPRARKRSHGGGVSPSLSPSDSPAVSPIGPTFDGLIAKVASPGERLVTRRINDDTANSPLHHKRLRFNPTRTPSSIPLLDQQNGPQDSDCDADVLQRQVEAQRSLSGREYPSTSPELQLKPPQEPSQMRSRYDMCDYPVLTQAPYDSQM